MRVLLVDDQPHLVELLRDELEDERYAVSVAHDGDTAWLVLMGEPSPDLVVLDWNLPDTSGPDLCRRMRATGITLPVLMLTGRDDVADRVAALDAGVDDYLVKPFSIEELLARLRALQRRRWAAAPAEPDELLELADLQVNATTREVRRGGQPVQLLEKEYELLLHLLRADGEVVRPEVLLGAIWGEGFANELSLLAVYAESLRQKLDGVGAQPLLHGAADSGLSVALEAR